MLWARFGSTGPPPVLARSLVAPRLSSSCPKAWEAEVQWLNLAIHSQQAAENYGSCLSSFVHHSLSVPRGEDMVVVRPQKTTFAAEQSDGLPHAVLGKSRFVGHRKSLVMNCAIDSVFIAYYTRSINLRSQVAMQLMPDTL
jgi:hypothetical protein